MEKTNFTKSGMINNPLPEDYYADDNGLYKVVYDRAEKCQKNKEIAQALSIAKISFDTNKNAEFVEFRFIKILSGSTLTSKLISISIRSSDLMDAKGLKPLTDAGFTWIEAKEVHKYILAVKMEILKAKQRGEVVDVKDEAGAAKFGFLGTGGDISNIDYNNFVGIDSDIIFSNTKMYEYDKNLFIKRGTLDGWKTYADKLAHGIGSKIIKLSPAIAVSGIVKSLPGFLTMDPPVIALTGASGGGKGFDANLIISLFGEIGKTNTFRMSETSTRIGLNIIKDRANILPVILDDIAPILDKSNGAAELKAMFYGHTNDSNRVVATTESKLNENVYTWGCPFIVFGEKNKLDVIKDGGANRYIDFDFGNKVNEMITDADVGELNKEQYENVGIVGPLFVKALQEDIAADRNFKKEFDEIKNDILSLKDMNTKIADNYALIYYSYKLLKEYDLLPATWELPNLYDYIDTYNEEKAVSTEQLIYDAFIDMVANHSIYYPDKSVKLTQKDYDNAETLKHKIQGRRTTETINGKTYKIVIILKENFDVVIKNICSNLSLTQSRVNPTNWKNEGWLIASASGKTTWSTTNITREYDAKDPSKNTKENCYKIILGELDNEEEAIEDIKLETRGKVFDKLTAIQKDLDNNIEVSDIVLATNQYIEDRIQKTAAKTALEDLLSIEDTETFWITLEEYEHKNKDIKNAMKSFDYTLNDEGDFLQDRNETEKCKAHLQSVL